MTVEVVNEPFPLEKLPPPGVIWHYTTIDSFGRILRKGIGFSHYILE